MEWLLDTIIRPAFADPELERRHDGALLDLQGPVAFATDGHVVRPLVFPGGDIGRLAVNGTLNDLAMCGARPEALSIGLIIEEGLELALLARLVGSMGAAARAAGVRLVTGDTKVVERGKGDGLFVTSAGVGRVLARTAIGPQAVRAGDAVILSGDIGRHGIAVLAARESLGFESPIESDCACVAGPVLALIAAGIAIRCLRDPTRGGLASAAVEVAEAAGLAIALDEAAIPVRAGVATACELLGLDPLHVASEGCFLAVVAPQDADRALAILRAHSACADAARIGTVLSGPRGEVSCRGPLGVARLVEMLHGEQLPRIC